MEKKDLKRVWKDLEKIKKHCSETGIFLNEKEPQAIDTVKALIKDMENNGDYGW
jgi:hypothetical protein